MTAAADIMHADCDEVLRTLAAQSVDLVVTDPAYESLEKHRKTGTTTRLSVSKGSSNEWFPIYRNERFAPFFAECYRILRDDRHLYMFCDFETARFVIPLAERAGFQFWNAIVWHKTGGIGMGYHYRRSYELILFFEKGKRRLTSLAIADVIPFDRVRNGYPTEKPEGLVRILIEQSTVPGELVLDPFLGAGTTLAAALALGRSGFGCDIAATAVAHASARMLAAHYPLAVHEGLDLARRSPFVSGARLREDLGLFP